MSIRETTGAIAGDSPGGTAGGDLGGSYPNPSVAKVKGITISATPPSAGQVLTATGATAADWETPSSGSPAGSNTQIQFNNSGAFGANSNLTFDSSINAPYGTLKIGTGSAQTGSLEVKGTTSPVVIGGDNNIAVFTDGVNAGAFIKVTADPFVVFEANTSIAMVSSGSVSLVCAGGGVAINQTAVNHTLDVNGDINAVGSFMQAGVAFFDGTTLTIPTATTINAVPYFWTNTQGAANTVLQNDGSGNLSWFTIPSAPNSVFSFTSTAGAGGAATETMTVTGLLSTDTILSVTQMTPGLGSRPMIGWANQANDALDVSWAVDPSSGSVIVVSVKR